MVNYTTITCLSFHDNYMYPLRKLSNPDPYPEEGGDHLRLFYFSLYVKDHLRFALLGYGSSVYLSDGILYLQIQKAASETYCLQNSVFLLYPFVWIRLARLVSPTSAPA